MSEENKENLGFIQHQYKVKGRGFCETYKDEAKAQGVFESQKAKYLKKKESFSLTLSERESLKADWVIIDEIKRSASFYEED